MLAVCLYVEFLYSACYRKKVLISPCPLTLAMVAGFPYVPDRDIRNT